MESNSTAKLIGAPPGYVGYDDAGQLTDKVKRHPYSIILLDEGAGFGLPHLIALVLVCVGIIVVNLDSKSGG